MSDLDLMKLWHLMLPETHTTHTGAVREVAVTAPTEIAARALASRLGHDRDREAWLDPTLATCLEVATDSEGVVMLSRETR